MGSASIRLANVTKQYSRDGEVAVRGVDLEIQPKELLVLLGPSGSGKSTVLNILAGLEEPSGGDLFFGAERMNGIPPEERDISMVFQSIALYPHLNVEENILFALRQRKLPQAEQQERLREVTGLLGITQYLRRRIHALSGGQRQRVAIAKALVKRPTLFLLDEPFSALDAKLRRDLRSELVRLHRQLDATMVFVTHDQEEAMSIADRIAVMDQGRLVQVSSALDLYYKPETVWVSQFIGAHPINLFTAQRTGTDWSVSAGASFTAPPSLAARLAGAEPGQITLGVRPEWIQLVPGEHPDGIAGEIFTRQVLGNEILYEVKVGDQLLNTVVPANIVLGPGDRVTARVLWEQVLIFDADSGKRLAI
jgi:ABC-type sugar transport system ATPase subunit